MSEVIMGILVSGRGTNMNAILDGVEQGMIQAEIGVVISDVPNALALEKATARGVTAACVERSGYPSRRAFEEAICRILDDHGVTHVALAGFMRILSSRFVKRYRERIVNIHPALLPAFPGLHGQRQALAHGVKVTGCTVHFVDDGVDTGPIIAQRAVPVMPDDTEETLAARILKEENDLYPEVVAALVRGELTVEGRIVRWRRGMEQTR